MPAGAPDPARASAPADAPTPATLRWAVVLLGVQTVGLAALVVLLVIADVRSTSNNATSATGLTVFAVLIAALFGLFTWALYHRRAWARGPALVLELLLLPVGYAMVTNGLAFLGVPVLIFAGTTAGLLLAPTTRAALGAR
jgi:hypothetical protein